MPNAFATTLRRCLEQQEMTIVELAKGLGVQPFDLFELTPVEEVPLDDTLYKVIRIASQLSPKSQQRILKFAEFERDL